MRAFIALLLHTLLAALLLTAGPARADAHATAHATAHQAAVVVAQVAAAVTPVANPAPAHIACDAHHHAARAIRTHGSTPRCKQVCLALSAGFSAVLPVPAHALQWADGASPQPDAHHALPAGRVVMPERRPPRAA